MFEIRFSKPYILLWHHLLVTMIILPQKASMLVKLKSSWRWRESNLKVEIQAAFSLPILSFAGRRKTMTVRRELGAARSLQCILSKVWTVLTLTLPQIRRWTLIIVVQASLLIDMLEAKTISNDYNLEAMKVDGWVSERMGFYILRAAQDRLSKLPTLSRALEALSTYTNSTYSRTNASSWKTIWTGYTIGFGEYRSHGSITNSGAPKLEWMRFWPCSSPWSFSGRLKLCMPVEFSMGISNLTTVWWDSKMRLLHQFRLHRPTLLLTSVRAEPVLEPFEAHYSPRGLCSWRKKALRWLILDELSICVHFSRCPIYRRLEVGEHECNEMREMRPWTHQIDLYGMQEYHAMLFGNTLRQFPISLEIQSRTPKIIIRSRAAALEVVARKGIAFANL